MEDNCFIDPKDNINNQYKEEKPYSVAEILKHKPEYLEIVSLAKYRDFKRQYGIPSVFRSEEMGKAHEEEFKIFKEKFQDEFEFSSRQEVGSTTYALGSNRLGYWLLKIQDNKPSAYF